MAQNPWSRGIRRIKGLFHHTHRHRNAVEHILHPEHAGNLPRIRRTAPKFGPQLPVFPPMAVLRPAATLSKPFLTGLDLYGAISRIPGFIQTATTGRAGILDSPVGQFEFLKMKPAFMTDGVEWSDTRQPYLLATREKALLGVLYISMRKNCRFAKLPELDLADSGFRQRKFARLLRELPYPIRIRSAIESRWRLLNDACQLA